MYSSSKLTSRLLAALALLLALGQTACKNEAENPGPTISTIRAYAAAPADSVITRVAPGAWIVIQGSNLKTATQVYFDGVAATFNSALLADNNLVVQIPATIPFALVPTDKLNLIEVVTDGGQASYKFPILAPPPVITAVSNEFANPGDYITLSGSYLYLISKITFPGNVDATDITAASDGTSVKVKVPAGTSTTTSTTSVITLKTQFGSTTAPFGNTTGMLLDFDGTGTMLWGSTVTNSTTLFPGGRGNYANFVQVVVPANNWDWYNGMRAINSSPADWVPTSQLSQPASSYALKFEIYVKSPFATGMILVTPADNWVYTARYEPWRTTANYTTTGWTTVTLTLDNFRLKGGTLGDGGGTQASTVGDIVGSVNEFVRFMYINDTATPLASLNMAIDNIRVVKIK